VFQCMVLLYCTLEDSYSSHTVFFHSNDKLCFAGILWRVKYPYEVHSIYDSHASWVHTFKENTFPLIEAESE
jgi:hypothetical protein